MVEPLNAYTLEEHASSDGYRWKYRKYLNNSNPPHGILVFIHGIQSHAGWYEYSCTHLSKAGYQVYFLDRRGAGINSEQRGDAPSFRRLLDDIAEFLTALPRTAPRGNTVARLPVFLGAISWGGKLGVALERRHPGLMDGLALLCPGFFSKVRHTLWQRCGIFFSRIFRPGCKYSIPLNDPELFTASTRWQQFLRDDPLRLHHATARLLIESFRLDAYLRFTTRYVHVPVLVLLAEQDRIIRNDKTLAFVDRFATPDKQIIEYPGAQHTLEFEPDPHLFLHDLLVWLDRHAETSSV